ncbi:MAG: hypothetical protein AAB217_18625 [Chloroflexota bacterium]
MNRELTKKEKTIVESIISNRIKLLDEFLDENIEEILSQVDELQLANPEKRKEALLLAPVNTPNIFGRH